MIKKYNESRILTLSIVGSLSFALIGVIWGIILNSHMIFFDGLYSLLGLFLSLISLVTVKITYRKKQGNYEKGKIESGVILFKAFVILSICLYGGIKSIHALVNGGRASHIENAIVYSLVSSLLCAFFYLYIKGKVKHLSSQLLKIESIQWQMDTIFSFGVLIGFLAALGLKRMGYGHLSYYVDPTLVLLSTIYISQEPIKIIKKYLKDFLYTGQVSEFRK